MKEFHELVNVIDHLLGPKGCPWDREQTLSSMKTSVMEEVYELLEAIDLNDNGKILEELGDLFFNAIFLCKLGEKEGRFQAEEVLRDLTQKLIRRHPHVFGDVHLETTQEIVSQWEELKKKEKTNAHRKSILDGIPKGLPALARAQKTIKRLKRANYPELPPLESIEIGKDEEALGKELLSFAAKAEQFGLDAESALLKILAKKENEVREWESKKIL
jgi:tetrapyrrole methylase family protein/MazG family protein